MLKIAICDDKPEESAQLLALLEDYSKENNINFTTEIFENGFLFLDAALEENSFHLCFLDIFMPAFSGIATAKELRNRNKTMHLIFCTSTREYAVESYALQATNYLVKPLDKKKFEAAMDDVLRKIDLQKPRIIHIPTANGLEMRNPDQISHVNPDGYSSLIYMRNQSCITSRLSFAELCKILAEYKNFALVSRSVLLNYDMVVGMENDNFVLLTGVKISIPRRKKKEITQNFLDYSLGN